MKIKTRPLVLNVLAAAFFVLLIIPKLSGQDADSLKLEKESRHFAFYAEKGDIEVLDPLAITLENNYARITDRLGIQIGKKIRVKVFPDLESFHAAIQYPDAPDWVVGSCIDDELLMVSPLRPGSMHTYESVMQVIVHEFAHIAVYYARAEKGFTTFPTWLNEGYAQYEAGQINDRVRKSVKTSLAGKAPPTWARLGAASMMEFGSMNGYGLSVTIVEFLVDTYGMDKLVLLIKEPEQIQSIYGLSTEALEKQWIEYIQAYEVK